MAIGACPSCGSPNPGLGSCEVCGYEPPPLIQHGTLLQSRYLIGALLGQGGMGVVYEAYDQILEERVALKLLRFHSTPDLARRFRAEIRLARRVSHRNVCRIHEYGEEHGLRFISMEYIEGENLRQVLKKRRLETSEATDIAEQVASGLEAIHEVGVIHRDLKPANIMRDCRGTVKLMDFGIAKEHHASGAVSGAASTATGQIIGTPEYMSPEQARGEKVDFRSDIYALGVVIFELFTGQVPFKADTPLAVILKHLHDPPPLDTPDVRAVIPAGLVPVLRKALAKSPEQRFANTTALVAALKSARDQVPSPRSGGVDRPASVPSIEPSLLEPQTATQVRASDPATELMEAQVVARPDTRRRHAGVLVVAFAAAAVAAGVSWWLARQEPLTPSGTDVAPPVHRATPSLPGVPPVPTPPVPTPSPDAPPTRQPNPNRLTPGSGALALPSVQPPATVKESHPSTPEPSEPPAPQPSAQPSASPSTVTATAPPPPATALDDVELPGPDVTPPQILKTPRPDYPPFAKRLNRETSLLVRVLVDESGHVIKAQITLGDASGLGFNEAAIAAAYRTTFTPARRNGIPVKMWANLPVVFSRR